jgi:hypothetical protein
MEFQEFRETVLNEVLKLITDKAIEVDGQRLVIETWMSTPAGEEGPQRPHYDEELGGSLVATFDTNSPRGEKKYPTLYGWRIQLTDT